MGILKLSTTRAVDWRGCPGSLVKNKHLNVTLFDFERGKNSQVGKPKRKGTIWDHLGSVAAFILGWNLGHFGAPVVTGSRGSEPVPGVMAVAAR